MPLAFHVDYWNRIGWVDPFSSPGWSARQRRYAEAFGLRSVYTPQLVLNGRAELVGSREGSVREEIPAVVPARRERVRIALDPAWAIGNLGLAVFLQDSEAPTGPAARRHAARGECTPPRSWQPPS